MGKQRGRPPKDISPEAYRRRKKAAEHIRAFRKEQHLTQNDLADILDVEVQAIRRYENERVDIPKRTAQALEHRTGWFTLYWQGYTECKTRQQFVQMKNSADTLADSIMKQYREHVAMVENYQILFSTCGYYYRYDFTNEQCPHQLTPVGKEADPVNLTDDELQALFDRMKATIAFECFRKLEGI